MTLLEGVAADANNVENIVIRSVRSVRLCASFSLALSSMCLCIYSYSLASLPAGLALTCRWEAQRGAPCEYRLMKSGRSCWYCEEGVLNMPVECVSWEIETLDSFVE